MSFLHFCPSHKRVGNDRNAKNCTAASMRILDSNDISNFITFIRVPELLSGKYFLKKIQFFSLVC